MNIAKSTPIPAFPHLQKPKMGEGLQVKDNRELFALYLLNTKNCIFHHVFLLL
jgi:hypothetical protein